MSKLAEQDYSREELTGIEVYRDMMDFRRSFLKGNRVPKEDLRFLVFLAIWHEEITISRAAEILGLSTHYTITIYTAWCKKDGRVVP